MPKSELEKIVEKFNLGKEISRGTELRHKVDELNGGIELGLYEFDPAYGDKYDQLVIKLDEQYQQKFEDILRDEFNFDVSKHPLSDVSHCPSNFIGHPIETQNMEGCKLYVLMPDVGAMIINGLEEIREQLKSPGLNCGNR